MPNPITSKWLARKHPHIHTHTHTHTHTHITHTHTSAKFSNAFDFKINDLFFKK